MVVIGARQGVSGNDGAMDGGSVYLFGAGPHAKVVIENLEASGVKVKGLFDNDPNVRQVWDYPVEEFPGDFDEDTDELIVTIGSNETRRRICQSLQVNYGSAIHPHAHISTRSTVGRGTVVMAGVVVNCDTRVGDHAIVNTSASIDHDCVIGDFAHVSPNATLCGKVRIGEGTHVGAGAVVIPNLRVGRWAVIGAGAVVVRDVPDGATVAGNPARLLHRRG